MNQKALYTSPGLNHLFRVYMLYYIPLCNVIKYTKLKYTMSCICLILPDCNRTCIQGSLVNCAYCSCEGHIVFGKVAGQWNQPLENVGVYHPDQQWQALTYTNGVGLYTLNAVCGNGISFYFKLDRYSEEAVTAQSVNTSASEANAKLIQYSKQPVIIIYFCVRHYLCEG